MNPTPPLMSSLCLALLFIPNVLDEIWKISELWTFLLETGHSPQGCSSDKFFIQNKIKVKIGHDASLPQIIIGKCNYSSTNSKAINSEEYSTYPCGSLKTSLKWNKDQNYRNVNRCRGTQRINFPRLRIVRPSVIVTDTPATQHF